jgi:hypothetical protein
MYKLIRNSFTSEATILQRLSDGAFIPFAPGNRDYQEYLAWLAQGNEPEPEDEVSE